MRFLHTSDWHVGRTIRNRSRIEEHRAVLTEVIEIAKREKIDAVLVTGDVFHDRRPPLEAEELVAETLAELARAEISSVVIPGNHDDPARLRTLKYLGDLVQAYIVSDFDEDLTSLVIPLGGQDGKEKVLIGCLPYLPPHQVLSAAESVGTSETDRLSNYQKKVKAYFRSLEAVIKRIDQQAGAIVLAHMDIIGSEFGGGELRSQVFPLNGGILPSQVQYVALGHIHKPQPVPGAIAQARYAGSILQMDFGERGQQKSVYLIDVHPGKPAEISQVHLHAGKALLRRNGTAETILSQSREFIDAWAEVVLQPQGLTQDLVEQVRALPGVISLRFEDLQTVKQELGGAVTQNGNGERPAVELFSEYYKIKRKMEPEPDLIALFNRLYQEVNTADGESS